MNENDLLQISKKFVEDDELVSAKPLGSGLINGTYIICGKSKKYVLQKLNTDIFTRPYELMENIETVTEHIRKKGKPTLFFHKCGNKNYYEDERGFFRLSDYLEDSQSFDIVTPVFFEEAGCEFGKFQYYLSDIDASILHETIADFHNTVKRLERFKERIKKDEFDRVKYCEDLIDVLLGKEEYAHIIVDSLADSSIPLRVVHNDTKISNVLFDKNGKGLCVIDLDTVMPGSLLFDFGDAIRSGSANEPEWSENYENVFLRNDLFERFVKGFIGGISGAITKKESSLLPMSAFVITYEEAIRFLDDYLDNDVYFKPQKENLNLIRAKNQTVLALDILSKLGDLEKITKKYTQI